MKIVARMAAGRWKAKTESAFRPSSARGESNGGSGGFQQRNRTTQAAKFSIRNGPSVHLSIQRYRFGENHVCGQYPCRESRPASTRTAAAGPNTFRQQKLRAPTSNLQRSSKLQIPNVR